LLFYKRRSVPPRYPLDSAVFPEFFPEKRLELKSLKRQTKAEELGDYRAVSQEKLGENLQSKTSYKFKKSYGGTAEPQTPRMHPGCADPLLKLNKIV
jgi:hypothetical protein